MEQGKNILLAEDDKNLGFVIKDNLEISGYNVVLCEDGKTGLQTFISGNFDLCILDIMMPKKDGFSLAKDIRDSSSDVPIIFLTAKSMKEDKIKGFKIGADDYITKPFSTEELLLRVKAILRRYDSQLKQGEKKQPVKIGKFSFDHHNLLLKSDEGEKSLTKKESDILYLLYLNKNEILTRETALKSIWGENDYFAGRSMDVFITKLRKYLKTDPSISIENVHGVGFKLIVET